MKQGYAPISIDATPPKQQSRFDETSRVDSLLNKHCTEIIVIAYTVSLYFDFFLF